MAEAVEVSGRAGLVEHLRSKYGENPGFDFGAIEAKPYGGDDNRIGWKDVHIVTAPDYGVIGFIEGPLET